MFFIKVRRYPEVLFNRHVLVLFETSDLIQVRIVTFISTILIPKLTYTTDTKVPTLTYHTKDIIERL